MGQPTRRGRANQRGPTKRRMYADPQTTVRLAPFRAGDRIGGRAGRAFGRDCSRRRRPRRWGRSSSSRSRRPTASRGASPTAPTATAGSPWAANTRPVRTSPQIGRITPAGDITEFRVRRAPILHACSDIVQGPDNVLYFTTNNPILGRITTSGEILASHRNPELERGRRRPGGARRRDLVHRLQQRQPLALRRGPGRSPSSPSPSRATSSSTRPGSSGSPRPWSKRSAGSTRRPAT